MPNKQIDFSTAATTPTKHQPQHSDGSSGSPTAAATKQLSQQPAERARFDISSVLVEVKKKLMQEQEKEEVAARKKVLGEGVVYMTTRFCPV